MPRLNEQELDPRLCNEDLPSGVVSSSDDDDLRNSMYLIYGAPKSGKTFLSWSVSEYYKLGPCSLDDICVVTTDHNALIGAQEWGIQIPHRLNIRRWLTPLNKDEFDKDGKPTRYHAKDITEAMDMCVRALTKLAYEGKIKTVIIDTISELDRPIVQYWFEEGRSQYSKSRGEVDTRRTYGLIAKQHSQFFEAILTLGLQVIALCHARVNTYSAKEDQSNSDRALVASGSLPSQQSLIVPDITGQSAKMYVRHSDHILVVTAEQNLKGVITRTVHPYGVGDWSGGTRLERTLKKTEKPNLKEIIEKVEAHNKSIKKGVKASGKEKTKSK